MSKYTIYFYIAVFGGLFPLMSGPAVSPAYSGSHEPPGRELVDAVRANDAVRVDDLLTEGADPDAAGDGTGTTPLIAAAENGNVKLVNKLLDAGADPGIADRNGDTAIHHAVDGGRKYAVEALIGGGAAFAVKDKNGSGLDRRAREAGYPHIADDIEALVLRAEGEIEELRQEMYDEAAKGDYEDAVEVSRRVYDNCRAAYGEKDLRTLSAMNDLAIMSMKAGRLGDAEELYRALYLYNREVFGPDSEQAAVAANNLGVCRFYRGDWEEAAGYFSEAYTAGSARGDAAADEYHANLLMAEEAAKGDGTGAGGQQGPASTMPAGPRIVAGGTFGPAVFSPADGQQGKRQAGLMKSVLFGVISVGAFFFLAYLLYRFLSGGSGKTGSKRDEKIFDAKMSLNKARLAERLDRLDVAVGHYERGLAVLVEEHHARFRLARIYHHRLRDVSGARRHYRKLIGSLPPDNSLRRESEEAIKSLRKDS